jgi:hypothetical protein
MLSAGKHTDDGQGADESEEIRQLQDTLIDLVGLRNRPQRGSVLTSRGGVSLDPPLFRLLITIERKEIRWCN